MANYNQGGSMNDRERLNDLIERLDKLIKEYEIDIDINN